MIEIALVASRWMQFAPAAILCGAPAFYLYGLPSGATGDAVWLRRLLLGATFVGVIAACLMLLAESAEMSGDGASAFKPDVVWAVMSDTFFGAVWIVRLILLLAMAFITTVIGHTVFFWGINKISVVDGSVIALFEPTTAIFLSLLLFGQNLSSNIILGGLLILLASVLISLE